MTGSKSMTKILYTEVKRKHRTLTQGHWFFHKGQWALCASTWPDEPGWVLSVYFEKWNKPLPDKKLSFATLDEAKKFVSDYYELLVVDCAPKDFPSPEAL
jgi:hypothetical protein